MASCINFMVSSLLLSLVTCWLPLGPPSSVVTASLLVLARKYPFGLFSTPNVVRVHITVTANVILGYHATDNAILGQPAANTEWLQTLGCLLTEDIIISVCTVAVTPNILSPISGCIDHVTNS